MIEDVDVDAKGNAIPGFNRSSRPTEGRGKMLNIGGQKERDISDAELVQQLADQAKELGIEIDLNIVLKPDE